MTEATDDLIFACMDLDLAAIRTALEAGAAPNDGDHERRRPVFHVLYDGRDERKDRSAEQREHDRAAALLMLLEHGMRMDRKDPKGLTAYERLTPKYPLCAQAYLRHVGTARGLKTAGRHLSHRMTALLDNEAELRGWWAAQAAVVDAETMAARLPAATPASRRGPRL